jgi:predicted nucleic acid-binding protein
VRFSLDSNILVYAVDAGTPAKRAIAREIMNRAVSLDAVLTVQALAEFLNVVRRKSPASVPAALAQAERWATLFPVTATNWEHVARGAALASRYKLQLWDCVILQAARSLQASILLSEDMQDGFSADGITILNPFSPANATKLAELLEKGAGPG